MLSGLTSQFSTLIKGKEEESTTPPAAATAATTTTEETGKKSRSGSGQQEGITLGSVRSSLPSWLGGGGSSKNAEEKSEQVEDGVTTTQAAAPLDESEQAEPAMDKVKNLGSFLFSGISTGIKSAGQKIKDTPNPLTTFQQSQTQFVNEKQQAAARGAGGGGVAPWVGHVKEQELKEEVLGLSGDRRNFLRPPPTSVQFTFNNEEFLPTARALLREDPALEKMRYDLVPKLVSEENFWRNYYYRVTLLKESLESPVKKQDSIDTDEDEEENAELEKELNEELKSFEVVDKSKESLSDLDLK